MPAEGAGAQAAQEQDDDDYDPFAEKPTEEAQQAPQEKAQAPAAKAPPAAPAAAGDDEAPWAKKAPWRKVRKRKAASQVELQLPAGPKLQAVPFDPDNLAASVKAITEESQKIIDKVSKRAKAAQDGKLKGAPWRAAQPQAPPPKAPPAQRRAQAQQLPPWRRVQQQQQPAPPPSKAGKASMSKAAGVRATRMGAIAKSQGGPGKRPGKSSAPVPAGSIPTKAGMLPTKASGIKATRMGAIAKSHGVRPEGLTKATGVKAAKMGALTKATGVKAAKMGALTKAAGVKAVKMGALSKATGVKAAKMGALTKAAGVKAVKMGALSKAAPGFHVRMRFRPPPPKAGPGFGLGAVPRPPPPKAGAKAAAPAQPWAKASMRQPWWAKQAASLRQSMQAKIALPKHQGKGKGKGRGDAKADAAKSAAETAKNFLQRPNNKRLHDAAAVAQEYFNHADGPAADGDPASKKPRLEAVGFAPELLEKAPSVLQTCRSLLEFLDKKRAALTRPAAEIEIAADLQQRLGQHADLCGRLAGLRRPGGWDARAKRIFDLGAVVGSAECQSVLTAAEARRDKARDAFDKELLERGLNDKSIEELTKERTAWADDQVRREWIAWCARIARAKEAELLAAAQQGQPAPGAPPPPAERLTAAGVVEAMLSGRLAGS